MESVYNILKHAHSGLRWVVLILLIYAVYNAFSKKKGGDYTEGDRKLNLFTMVSTHTMLLIGLIMYFMNPYIHLLWGNMGAAMKISAARHMVLEHPLGMLAALVLITIGHSKSKKASGADKHKKIFTFYLIGLILILLSIPWPFRFEGAGWF
ncbi:MAG TPA: hypothetical protein VD905_19820 [Flavobacteriales bacterium]|nr:hypothetical protein [Flavobacteriales bacterium]